MPYLKFTTKSDELKFFKTIEDLAHKNNPLIPGLVSRMNDPQYGLVIFFSEELYLNSVNGFNVSYEVMPKEKITASYAAILRQKYPQYGTEL